MNILELLSRFFLRTEHHPRAHTRNNLTFGKVEIDAVRVVCIQRDGRKESVRWDELQEVRIITTDQGPFMDDMYWILSGKNNGCVIPGEAEGVEELLSRLQALPDFDNRAFIRAMGSTTNAQFVCWTKPQGPSKS